MSFVRNFGSGFEEAKASGASDAEALTAAGLFGLANALIESSGGIEALPGIAKTGGFRTWAGSALQEGLEEPVQSVVSNAVSKGIYDHARPVVSLTDESAVLNPNRAGREFALGTAVGAIVGGGEMLGNTVMNTGRGFGSYEAGTDGYSNQSSQAITAVQNTNIDVNEPKHVGRATVLKNPYTGKVPIYTMPANRVKPVVTAESVQTAADNIRKAKTAVETTGKSYRNFLTDFLEEVFIRRGGAHDVKVNGLTFDGEAYNVSVHKSAIGKLVSDPNMSAEKLAVLDVLDEVIGNGEYVGSNNYVPKGNKRKHTIRFDLFETPVFIEVPTKNEGTKATEYIVTFDVEVFPDSNNYRTHKVIYEMDLTPVHRTDTGSDQPQGSGKQDPSNQSIAQYREYVNRMEGSEGLQTQAEILRQMEAVRAQYRKELGEAELEQAFLHGFNLEE